MRLDLKGSLLDLALLSALMGGSSYGYDLTAHLRERSQGLFNVAQGTVYLALQHLEKARLVSSEWEAHFGRRTRRYRLTASGRKELTQWTARWHEFSAALDRAMPWRMGATHS